MNQSARAVRSRSPVGGQRPFWYIGAGRRERLTCPAIMRAAADPGPFTAACFPCAVLCVVTTTGACNPLDVLHYLPAAKDGSSSRHPRVRLWRPPPEGEWTKLITADRGARSNMWPDYVTPCSGY